MAGYTSEEIGRFVQLAGESRNVDAKGPVLWDRDKVSGELAKDIMAFANSQDGGVLVIGKSEPSPNEFSLDGLTPDEAASFETTKVAAWVNAHCHPSIDLVCHRVTVDEKEFVVITVEEFREIPVICKKSFTPPSDQRSKPCLREGAVYIRTANAESAPLRSVEEMRELIGLAVTKRLDDINKVLQAAIHGRSLLPASDDDQWSKEIETVRSGLIADSPHLAESGGWDFTLHPTVFQKDRWPELESLRTIVEQSAVRMVNEFPSTGYGAHPQTWGFASSMGDDRFALTREGLIVALRFFYEDRHPYRRESLRYTPSGTKQHIEEREAGSWLQYRTSIGEVIEMFLVAARICERFEPGETVEYAISARPLAGRRLVFGEGSMFDFRHYECRAQQFDLSRTVEVCEFIATWEDRCAEVLVRFFELFESRATAERYKQHIDDFMHRRF